MEIKLLGGCSKDELEARIQKVATAGKLSRFSGNVFEVLESCNDYNKNLNLIKRIIKMGHKSIIEHDYLVFAICDVTPIIEQTIIGNRLTSFTIKSRREVDFRNANFYVPEFRNTDGTTHKDNVKLQEAYIKHMKFLFNTYGSLVDSGIDIEDARFILPYSFYSNIIMGLDARSLENLVCSLLRGPLSKISELKDFGEKLYSIIKEYVPYLVDNIEDSKEYSNDDFTYLNSLYPRSDIKILDKPKLLSYTPNPDEVIIKSCIMYNYQCTEETASKIMDELYARNPNYMDKLMNIILHKKACRELEQVSFSFQIPISLSILTHLTRHRMHSLLVPDFLSMWDLKNYITPPTIKSSPAGLEMYNKAISKNLEIYEQFKNSDIYEADLIYFYLGCQMLNVVTTINGRSLQWILRMRCCNKAQWQIRNIAKEIANQVKQVAPLFGKGLGPTCITDLVCYEGRESCGLINSLLKNKEKDT